MKPIILASTSPRRLEMLSATGLPYTAVAPDFVEDNTQPLPPPQLVEQLALGKARAAAGVHHEAIIIAADTLVALDGKILAKPTSAAEVRTMITSLSGRWHSVVTGLAILSADRQTLDHVETKVRFSTLSPDQITQYAALTDPLDKAGAYGIQPGSAGSLFIDRVEGDYQSVVGLPIFLLRQRLLEFNIDLLDFAH